MSSICPKHLLVSKHCSKIYIRHKANYFYTEHLLVLNCCIKEKLILIMGGTAAETLSETRLPRTVSGYWVELKYFN